ncbi:MAG: hypothetical protein HY760_04910 [Nitrospirae bacterium]|nr:hypothetical protein [Nitrospirota bacterium]
MLSGVRGLFLPNRVLYLLDPSAPPSRIPEFARGKETTGKIPATTVCRNFTCSAPVGTWEELKGLLGK